MTRDMEHGALADEAVREGGIMTGDTETGDPQSFADHIEAFLAPVQEPTWSPDAELQWALGQGYVELRDGRYVITEAGRRAPEYTGDLT